MVWFAPMFLSLSVSQGFYADQSRGWHWYEVLPQPEKEKPKQEETTSTSLPKSPTEQVKAYQKELEHLLHQAWLNPTSENVRAYQLKQKDMTDRSKNFSITWMSNVYQNPGLDHTLISPVNQQARHLQLDQEKKRTHDTISQLSQSYGLFFFFSSQCPYCHQFAPIVKRFSQLYGWEVIAISIDGGSVAEFPASERDNGLVHMWNIQTLPSLYAVNPQTQEAIPIAHGLTSMDEMENRIIDMLGALS